MRSVEEPTRPTCRQAGSGEGGQGGRGEGREGRGRLVNWLPLAIDTCLPALSPPLSLCPVALSQTMPTSQPAQRQRQRQLSAPPAHREEDVVVQEVCGQALDLLGEGGREEQGLALAGAGHVLLIHNPAGQVGRRDRWAGGGQGEQCSWLGHAQCQLWGCRQAFRHSGRQAGDDATRQGGHAGCLPAAALASAAQPASS